MSLSARSFHDWQDDQMKDPEFAAEARKLEPGYQLACLRIERGLTQAQLAEIVGTKQPSIARLERGDTVPSLAFLERVARALDARIEIHVVGEPPER